ncbi:UbiD family decarboxylase [Streptomyces sp. NPDC050147]|uniref:UbiD family decarboxylase n=1 Tax=Streptomyces sp. NPDC050147 TaxID=3155513 RepID=UPI0034346DAC
MTGNPGLSVRAALAQLRTQEPEALHEYTEPMPVAEVAAHFAAAHAGVPAVGASRSEPAVLYRGVKGFQLPVLLGLYGDAARLRRWLPGLPDRAAPDTVVPLLAAAARTAPREVADAPCRAVAAVGDEVDLLRLPVLTSTPRDAGPYLTTALIRAEDPVTGETALSCHRMLVLDRSRLTVWMVPGRKLGELHRRALERGDRLPVSVSIGVPPAVMVASAVNTAFLGPGDAPSADEPPIDKLALAGALAGEAIELSPGLTQPVPALAQAEIVIEGHLDDQVADEALDGAEPGLSLPEFLGYDGRARSGLPVLTVTAVTTRHDPLYQAVVGPGREQSYLLGTAGALSVALSLPHHPGLAVHDLHFAAAGGGMLLLTVAVRKASAAGDTALPGLAREILRQHPFVKTVVLTDEDIAVSCTEDVLWAMTTRSNLAADCTEWTDLGPVPMDPSQTEAWAEHRAAGRIPGRVALDATTPFALRATTRRSFAVPAPRPDRVPGGPAPGL